MNIPTNYLTPFNPIKQHTLNTDVKAKMTVSFKAALLTHMVICAPPAVIAVTHGIGTERQHDDTTWTKPTSSLTDDDKVRLSLLNGDNTITTDILRVDLTSLAEEMAEAFYLTLGQMTEVHRMEVMARMGVVHSMGKHTQNDPRVIAKLLVALSNGTKFNDHDRIIIQAAADLINNITVSHPIPHNSKLTPNE